MLSENLNLSTLIRKARSYSRKLWVRVILMGTLSVFSLWLTQLLQTFVPEKIATLVKGSSADTLLSIIANAMLAVTTFSLTVMVSVYQSSSTQWTPRVHRLIIQDPVTQNTLAVFIGAYVYALAAIIMRELGLYDDEHSFVLFFMTVFVIAVIVIYLIRWVLHLQTFGSLINTTRQLEEATENEFRNRFADPCLGAHPLTGDIPENAKPIHAGKSGYIQHIYPEALNDIAKAHGVAFYFCKSVGSFIFEDQPLLMAYSQGTPQEDEADPRELHAEALGCIEIDDVRTFDQDPRFGLISLGEVASKALSPGVNDPGTAIDVITRLGRILLGYRRLEGSAGNVRLDHLYIKPIAPADLIEDAFGALSRDGEDVIEVQIRLQHTLKALMGHSDSALAAAAHDFAVVALLRAYRAISFEHDRQRVLECAQSDVRAEAEKLL